MKKNILALTVYRSVKAANDEGTSAVSTSSNFAPTHLPLAERRGWDPFEVWRTRIRSIDTRDPRRQR